MSLQYFALIMGALKIICYKFVVSVDPHLFK